MSSLTSPSVNKNTTRFAPKVKQKERRGSLLKSRLSSSTSQPKETEAETEEPRTAIATKPLHPMTVDDPTLGVLPPPSKEPSPPNSPVNTSMSRVPSASTLATASAAAPSSTKKRPSTTSTTFSAPSKGEHATGHHVSTETSPPHTTHANPTRHGTVAASADDNTVEGGNDPKNDNSVPPRPKRRRRSELTTDPLVTLDDISHDPAQPELIQKPLSYFVDNLDTGVVSRSYKEMKIKANNQTSAAFVAAAAARTKEKDLAKPVEEEPSFLQESSSAPQVRFVDGEIVLDTSSLYIHTPEGKQVDYEVVEEDSMTNRINSRTHGKQHFTSPGKRWTTKEIDLFYSGIGKYGTDFEMIASIIPSRTRKEVKLMFNRQEKRNPTKITDAIMQRPHQGV
ncbi:hypothetical protein [Absidia glauca]|uniref:SANT domain-containing protein n=1 Tax=Absidia glauca TaxID=4829 RepID=A0A168QLL3_ABSGL|nr:hypothetical protein [Absidia glauca]